jgi:hypothetical protein
MAAAQTGSRGATMAGARRNVAGSHVGRGALPGSDAFEEVSNLVAVRLAWAHLGGGAFENCWIAGLQDTAGYEQPAVGARNADPLGHFPGPGRREGFT